MTEVLLTNVVGHVRLIHASLPLLENPLSERFQPTRMTTALNSRAADAIRVQRGTLTAAVSGEAGEPQQQGFHLGGRYAAGYGAGGRAQDERTFFVGGGEAAVAVGTGPQRGTALGKPLVGS
jgi:hypothetical protein